MIQFHPDENILIEYSAGVLDRGLAIGVKAHVCMCPRCQEHLHKLNCLGATLLENTSPPYDANESDEETSLNNLLQKIRNLPSDAKPTTSKQETGCQEAKTHHDLPAIVRQLLHATGELKWRRMSPSLKQANLTSGQNSFEVCLHKIRQGGKVAEHDHRGRELTLVLQGTFSDEQGAYKVGDFIMRDCGDVHRPTATQDQDCLCLTITEAPVKLTGLMHLFNPFLPFQPG